MSNYINQVSDSLKNHISELANNPCLFLRNPNVDFSRKRKIDFKTFIGIMMNSGGATMSKELLDFFDFNKILRLYQHLRNNVQKYFQRLLNICLNLLRMTTFQLLIIIMAKIINYFHLITIQINSKSV